jgi:hypothetical protein
MALSLRLLGDRSRPRRGVCLRNKYNDVFPRGKVCCSVGKTVTALQYAFEGSENHNVGVYAAERRAPMHRTVTNLDMVR